MNVLFSVVYPKSKIFFKDFIESVNSQSSRDFLLVLCLNGTKLNKGEKELINVNHVLFKTNMKWQKARIFVLKKIFKLKPKFIIFADSDDIMTKDRVKISLKKIKLYKSDFLTNNILLFGKNYKNKKKFFSFKNDFKIKLKDIDHKNFVGCSNTIVKTKALKKVLNHINTSLVAFDWCMAKLLLLKKFKGFYVTNCLTLYRQYEFNNSSILNKSLKQKIFDIREKINHYKYFLPYKENYKLQISQLNKIISNTKSLKSLKKGNLWWDYRI